MTLQEKLNAYKANFESGGTPYKSSLKTVEIMHRATAELSSSGIMDRVLKAGDRAPDFVLPDHQGEFFNSRTARSRGCLVVDFYRGVW